LNIKQEYIRPNKFTRPGLPLRKVTAIAIHYTGDPGATAQNERDYFGGTCITDGRYASCHYCVGMDGEIVQLIPESEWAYCTCQANAYSISIETCHPDESGKFTAAAEKSLIELTASLCKKYGLNPQHGGVVRHYDVTGKECPLWYVTHPAAWTGFQAAVANCMAGKPYSLPSSGQSVSTAPAVNPYYCDTTSLTRCPGMVYTFKTGGAITCATDAFKQVSCTMDNGYRLTTFRTDKPTAGVGFYINDRRVCVATVKEPYSDTTKPFSKRVGQTYTFKTDFPLVCGSGSVFEQASVSQSKGYYYTKYRAITPGTAGFYCGSTRVCIGTVTK